MEQLDRNLFLLLNGSDSIILDNFFLIVTRTSTWIPLLLVLLYVVFTTTESGTLVARLKRLLLFAVVFALVILVCDQTASGLCKPLFHRLRPSHEPALYGLVDLVNGRRGGLYGFFSSHAANSFGVATFVALTLRRRLLMLTFYLWAILTSYSRIYLAFHYPGDIFVGLLFGLLAGWLFYKLYVRCTPSTDDPPKLKQVFLLPLTFILTLFVIVIFSL